MEGDAVGSAVVGTAEGTGDGGNVEGMRVIINLPVQAAEPTHP
jgi:hypothetical protein